MGAFKEFPRIFYDKIVEEYIASCPTRSKAHSTLSLQGTAQLSRMWWLYFRVAENSSPGTILMPSM